MKTETIELTVKVKINYDDLKHRKGAIAQAKRCVLSTSILGTVGAIPKSVKLISELKIEKTPTIPKRTAQRLAKAKKLYPIGTIFISIFGANDTVKHKSGHPDHWADDDGNILVQGWYEPRMVFDGKWWADIIK